MDTEIWWQILYAIVIAIAVAVIAQFKGQKPVFWFLYGVVIWPVALAHILIKPKTPEAVAREAHTAGRRPCPYCAEMIMRQAQVCPYCQRDLASGWSFANIPEIEKYMKHPQGSGTEEVEVYLFAGKEYPSLDIAESARNSYIAGLRAQQEGS